ncbi:MAG: hypothetical protein ACOYO1_04925 [Bacteroidales bacterium]
MKISARGFNCLTHSWGNCSTSIIRALKKLNNEVHICSTNGYKQFPEDLKENIKCTQCTIDNERKNEKCTLDKNYDLGLSYTIPLHWHEYMSNAKVKMPIYNFDSDILPVGWGKYHKFVNCILPSSQYSKNTFLKAGIPEEKLIIVPHGYNPEFINRTEKYQIKSDTKYKVLVNIQQPHLRKNIVGILESFGKAFTNKDDICLVAKVRQKNKDAQNEISFINELSKVKKKYNKYPEVVIINDFIPYISDLYRACDIVFSMSHIECWHLPSLEALASDKINICSGFGGNTDFCNENNSLLISGELRRAPPQMFYWENSAYGSAFYPNINEAAEKLRYAYENYDELKQKFEPGFKYAKEEYTWDNAANKIIKIYEERK